MKSFNEMLPILKSGIVSQTAFTSTASLRVSLTFAIFVIFFTSFLCCPHRQSKAQTPNVRPLRRLQKCCKECRDLDNECRTVAKNADPLRKMQRHCNSRKVAAFFAAALHCLSRPRHLLQ